jgi:predicted RNA-binding Zn-ribbon protein involved in translation (DUF1610 family)
LEEFIYYALIFAVSFALTYLKYYLRRRYKHDTTTNKKNNQIEFNKKTAINNQYANRINSASTRQVAVKKDDAKMKALLCPNCGAPLKAIYYRCEYCGLSYIEAQESARQK